LNITLLIQSIAGLVVLLALLLFLMLFSFKTKKKELKKTSKQAESAPKQDTSLEALRKVIRDSHTSSKILKDTLDLVLKFHGTIHPKLGMRPHPDFDSYAEILFTLSRHKHVNKDILLKFDKELEKRNPEYKKEINDALMRGLNSRGV